ncbi:hypothetical protein GGP95_001225 [Salinibacter ruber]|nr:hypothetical protein [Salinibacter ruber]
MQESMRQPISNSTYIPANMARWSGFSLSYVGGAV